MEKTNTFDFAERPSAEEKGVITGCPFWFFGDEDSATEDLTALFEVVD